MDNNKVTPYDYVEELVKDMIKHNSRVKRRYGENIHRMGITYQNGNPQIMIHEIGEDFYDRCDYEWFKEHYVWEDGTPIGKIINND